jgi:hypothetical protein
MIFMATEGFGKTTFAAHAPDSAILMARGETGYATLRGSNRAPDRDATTVDDWAGLLSLLDQLADGPTLLYKYLALDALGGFERLCHEAVCKRDFGGDWGEKGFAAFARGPDVAVTDWLQFLQRLDKIHARGCGIIILSHCRVKPYRNPIGSDFDRYTADVHEKTRAATHKWADAALFGNFRTIVDRVNAKSDKGKGIGGADRVVYTERRDAFDAKNRYGLPEEIDLPNDPTASFQTIIDLITKKA